MNQRDYTNPRLSREDWLEESLRILAQEGDRPITVEVLCERLGVSRGSFYWHFKDTEDFHVAVIEHWEELSTIALRDAVMALAVITTLSMLSEYPFEITTNTLLLMLVGALLGSRTIRINCGNESCSKGGRPVSSA